MSTRTSLVLAILAVGAVSVILYCSRSMEPLDRSSGGLRFAWDKRRQQLTVEVDASGESEAVLVPLVSLGTLAEGGRRWTFDGKELDSNARANEMVLDWSSCVVLRQGYRVTFRVLSEGQRRIEINVGSVYSPSLEKDCARLRIRVWKGEVSIG